MISEYPINDSDYHSLLDYYNATRVYYFGEEESSEVLFSGNEARKYINLRFESERKNPYVKRCLDKITDFRAKHTVSAYFFGLTARKMLLLDTRDWRRLPGESKSSSGSFKLFWTWICLFHDIGYIYEDPSDVKKKAYSELGTIDDFIDYEKLSYNFLDYSQNSEIIRNYYKYRMSKHGKLDHGIAGALLLFNALMSLVNDEKYKDIYSEIKEYTTFYARICDAIAKHNMWRATVATRGLYEEFKLFDLMPEGDNHHKIFYRDNALEFLLALVDTIDPLKAFYQNRRYKTPIEISQILNDVKLRFFKKQKAFIVAFDHPLFKEKIIQYINPEDSLDSWLGVWIQVPDSTEYMRIDIDTSGTAAIEK